MYNQFGISINEIIQNGQRTVTSQQMTQDMVGEQGGGGGREIFLKLRIELGTCV